MTAVAHRIADLRIAATGHASIAEAYADHARRKLTGELCNLRPYPGLGQMGECFACGSTLIVLDDEGRHTEAAQDASDEAWEAHMAQVLGLPAPFDLGDAGG